MKKVLAILLSLGLSHYLPPALAAETKAAPAQATLSLHSLLEKIATAKKTRTFSGIRRMVTVRHDPKENVDIEDKGAFQIQMAGGNLAFTFNEPSELRAVHFVSQTQSTRLELPGEDLLFKQLNFPCFERVLSGSFSEQLALIEKNYDYKLLNPNTANKGIPAIAIEFIPRNMLKSDYGLAPLVPRHRFWLAKSDLKILKEERYWDALDFAQAWIFTARPYAVLDFTPDMAQTVPTLLAQNQPSRQIELPVQSEASTPSQPASHHHFQATDIPAGFVKQSEQFYRIGKTWLATADYTDGLNDLMILIQPGKAEQPIQLLPGPLANQQLLNKLEKFLYLMPFNYYQSSQGNLLVSALGDLHPQALAKLGSAVNLDALKVTD